MKVWGRPHSRYFHERNRIEDAVARVRRVPPAPGCIGLERVDGIGQRLVEVELGRELVRSPAVGRDADLEMDVDGAAAVPAGVDGRERGVAAHVGGLVAAQEFAAARIEEAAGVAHVGVGAERIALSEIDARAGQWSAGVAVHAVDADAQVDARAVALRTIGRVDPDVGPLEHLVHEVRTLGLLGSTTHERNSVARHAADARPGTEIALATPAAPTTRDPSWLEATCRVRPLLIAPISRGSAVVLLRPRPRRA